MCFGELGFIDMYSGIWLWRDMGACMKTCYVEDSNASCTFCWIDDDIV